jgi:glycosyltransferase involved in cell wall biosynthesis
MCGLPLRSPYFLRACFKIISSFRRPSLAVMDQDLGYPCWRQIAKLSKERQWFECLDKRLQDYKPDIILSHNIHHTYTSSLLNHAVLQDYPVFYFLRSLSKDMESGSARLPDKLHAIANAPFTASAVSKLSNQEIGIVLPFVDLDNYQVSNRSRQYITFINPIPQKGLEIAIEIASLLPQEKFLFVKGKWGNVSSSYIETCLEPAYKLSNIEVWEHQQDMRHVYGVTDILLVPSQFIETFGRVIIEAQVNGIPVVASNVGGISYTLGAGGILVDPADNLQMYVDALKKLRTNESFYKELEELALQNSQRPEFRPQYQVQNFIHFVESRTQIPTS